MRQSKPRSRKKSGFSEDAAPDGAGPPPSAPVQQTVELGAGGRLVIPAPMRVALGMKVGDRLTVRLEGDELRVYTYLAGIRRMQKQMRRHLPKNAVDEFLRWKRDEAAKEEAKLGIWDKDERNRP
jgi:bifunctional DNA-binding transcriptional regulator/antitoxin component of YhaV-PrlF toxin-antitoxin module